MNRIQNSYFSKNILIESDSENDAKKVNEALKQINASSTGANLLKQINDLSINGKMVIIKIVDNHESSTRPKLTEQQCTKHKVTNNHFDSNHNKIAANLAEKKSVIKKGEGTSAFVVWNKTEYLSIDGLGFPTVVKNETLSFITLVHELIHAYRILKGTYSGSYGDVKDPTSPKADEEFRAVGIRGHENKKFSENTVRRDHDLPIRAHYFSSQTFS